jgi:hypothetical protein
MTKYIINYHTTLTQPHENKKLFSHPSLITHHDYVHIILLFSKIKFSFITHKQTTTYTNITI